MKLSKSLSELLHDASKHAYETDNMDLCVRIEAALNESSTPVAKKPVAADRCCFCSIAIEAGEPRVINAFVRKLKPAIAHRACAKSYRERSRSFQAWCDARPANVPFDPKTASICACGHHASSHKTDALDSLLACEASRCTCDHFRMQNQQDADPEEAAA